MKTYPIILVPRNEARKVFHNLDRKVPIPCGLDVEVSHLPKGISTKWVAFIHVPGLRENNVKDKLSGLKAGFCDGWNHSWHASWYQPHIYAWGRSPTRAKKRLLKAITALKDVDRVDEIYARFVARNHVRSGD